MHEAKIAESLCELYQVAHRRTWSRRFQGIGRGSDGDDQPSIRAMHEGFSEKDAKDFYLVQERGSESKSTCFPEIRLEIDELSVVLAAFSTKILLRPTFSLTLSDICPSVGYPMGRRKSGL